MESGIGRLYDKNCEEMRSFQKYVEDNWLKIATNSQLVEQWVKDSNECTVTGKDEKVSNIYAIIRPRTVMTFSDDTSREHKDRIRKASKLISRGRLGERIEKRTGTLEIVNDKARDDVRGSMLIETIIKKQSK